MTAAKWTVGQEVLLIGYNQRRYKADPDTGVVVKVARKYVTVESGDKYKRTTDFDMETGYARGEYGSNVRCVTPEQYAEQKVRVDVTAALRTAGVEFRYSAQNLTNDQLAAILAIVTGEVSP